MPAPEYVPGELIVKLKEGHGLKELENINSKLGARPVKGLFLGHRSSPEVAQALDKEKTGLEGKEHAQWYWWFDKDSVERREYQVRLEKEKEESDRSMEKTSEGSAPQPAVRQTTADSREDPFRNLEGTYLFRADPSTDIPGLVSEYREHPAVQYAEPNGVVHALATPNDPRYSELWGLAKIQAPLAWETTTGSAQVIVAVIDTGIDYTHPDLAGNVWTNPVEIPGNGIDDDGNGFIDDLHGYDFFNRDPDPLDDHFHGTHVAGTIGAVGNNATGVVGVNWSVRLMAVKFLSSSGSGSTSDAILSIQYAVQNGAHILSNSWGGTGFSQALQDAITAANTAGCLVVAAAGNSGSDALQYPAALTGVEAVSATDSTDQKASFSTFGSFVDLAAPGVGILSTALTGSYRLASGTSMACPHVSGLAALIKAKNFSLTQDQIIQVLRNSADDLGILGRDDIYGYGRINAYKALSMVPAGSSAFPTAVISSPPSNEQFDRPVDLIGTAGGSTFSSYRLEAAPIGATNWVLIGSGTTPVVQGSLGRLDPAGWNEGPVVVRLNVVGTNGAVNSTSVTLRLIKAQILSPKIFEELAPGSIPVMGTATGMDFVSYTLEYGVGERPANWVTLTQSATRVVGGLLGTLTLPPGTDGYYTIRLRVQLTGGALEKTVPIYIRGGELPNWPYTLVAPPGVSGFFQPHPSLSLVPMVGDTRLFAPMTPATGTGTSQYYLFMQQLRADGTPVVGWPPGVSFFEYSMRVSHPAVGDLDGDATPEVVFTAYVSYSIPKGVLYVLNPDGTVKLKIPFNEAGNGYYRRLTPTLADLDGDGFLDILVGGGPPSGSLFAFDRFGNRLPGFPVIIPNADPSEGGWPLSLAVADLNGDGKQEIGFSLRGTDGIWKLYIYRSDGTPFIPPIVSSSGYIGIPVIGPITGNGPKIIASTGDPAGPWKNPPPPYSVSAWEPDGRLLPGWPVSTRGFIRDCSLGDLDGDGVPEVVGNGHSALYAIKGNGTSLPGWPIGYDEEWIGAYQIDPVLADVDGDGRTDVVHKRLVPLWIYGTSQYPVQITRVYAYRSDATLIPGYPKQVAPPISAEYIVDVEGTPAVGDFNGDGRLDLMVGGGAVLHPVDGGPPRAGRIHAWSLPTPTGGVNIQWGKYRGDLVNTGTYKLPPLPDTTSPTVSIISPLNGSIVSNTLGVTANASDNVGVLGVQFKLDGANLGPELTVAPYSISWNTLAAVNGSHTLTAIARDAAGNSTTSLAVSVTVSNDATNPTVSITSPASGTSYTTAQTVTINASATDNVGVTKVEFYDGALLKGTALTAPYTFSWTLTASDNGSHSWTAKAYDAAGNSGVSSIVLLTVNIPPPDTTAPTVNITAPAGGSTLSGTITVSANASDNVGVTKVEFYVDGTLKGTDTTLPYSISLDTTLLSNGSHTLLAKAYDAAGNAGSSGLVNVSVSNVTLNHPPVLAPIGPKAVRISNTLRFTVSASDPDGDPLTYSASPLPSGATFSPSTQTFTWKPKGNQVGTYRVTFSVTDGKLSASETVTITVTK